MLKKLKSYRYIIIVGIIVIFTLPILIDVIVFRNNYISNVSNDGWAAFLGAYIGSIVTLLGVFITILNMNSENEKIVRQNKLDMREEKRLSIIPYLNYKLKNVKLPDRYSLTPICVDLNDSKCFRKAYEIEITNCGLSSATDLSIDVYVNGEVVNTGSEHIDLVDVGAIGKSLRVVFALPNNFEANNAFVENGIYIVVFYKDLLMNQYAQELSIEINYMGLTTENNIPYNFYFTRAYKPKLIYDQFAYELPKWHDREKRLTNYKKLEFREYLEFCNESIVDTAYNDSSKVFNVVAHNIEKMAKDYYQLTYIRDMMGDLIGYKRIDDDTWESVFFEEKGLDEDNVIIYFVKIASNETTMESKVQDIYIFENTLSEDDSVNSKFNEKIKKKYNNL